MDGVALFNTVAFGGGEEGEAADVMVCARALLLLLVVLNKLELSTSLLEAEVV